MGSIWPSKTHSALNYLQASLEAISVSNGFQSNVAYVAQLFENADVPDQMEYPRIFIVSQEETIIPTKGIVDAYCEDESILPITIFGFVFIDRSTGETEVTANERVRKLQQDISAVLKADVTLGGDMDSMESYKRQAIVYWQQHVHAVIFDVRYRYTESPLA